MQGLECMDQVHRPDEGPINDIMKNWSLGNSQSGCMISQDIFGHEINKFEKRHCVHTLTSCFFSLVCLVYLDHELDL